MTALPTSRCVDAVYEIRFEDGQTVDVIVPSASGGGTIDTATLISTHQATGSSTQQSSVYDQAVQRGNHTGVDDFNTPASSSVYHIDFTGNSTGFKGIGAGAEDFGYYRGNTSVWTSSASGMFASTLSVQTFTTTDNTGSIVLGSNSSGLDMNGTQLILDADADTSITADTDDRIDFRIGGTDELTLTAAKADNLDDIAALTPTDGNIIVGNGTDWVAESGATARTSLGLGTADTPTFDEVTGTTKVNTPDVEATTSAGVTLSNNGGTTVLTAGAGGGTGITAAGGVNITGNLTVSGDTIIATETPASASATGTAGQIAWDADYIYICTATDTWKRVAIATW